MKFATLFLLAHAALQATLLFEPNRGQTAPDARFLARTPSGAVFFTETAIVLNKDNQPIYLTFAGSKPSAWQAEDPTGQTTSYFIGRDSSKWIRGLSSYKKLVRKDVYPDIDLAVYGNRENELEYDLIVAPGADPSRIRLRISASAVIDAATGDLVISQNIRQHKPVIYQDSKRIEGRFKAAGKNEYGFEIAAYDRSKPLVIDPIVESREYFGGIGDETVVALSQGALAAVGTTTSIDFPGSSFAARHGTDIYYRSSLGSIVIGGSGNEKAAPILYTSLSAVNTIIGGTTDSRDLPTGNNSLAAFQPEYAGGASDGFIAQVPRSGNSFNYFPRVTYFGTSGEDRITAGQAGGTFAFAPLVFAGSTNGSNLPQGTNTGRRTPSGGFDGFVVIADWSTFGGFSVFAVGFIGGSGDDFIHAVSSPNNLDFYIAGETQSADFPGLSGFQTQRKGASDAFVARIRWTGDLPQTAGTLLGGASTDRIRQLAVLSTGEVAVGGTTASTDFPVTGAVQASYGGGASDAFLTVFDAGLTRTARSTYWGGSGDEDTLALAADFIDNVTIAGRTTSTNFPLRNALQTRYGGGVSDGFFVQADATGTVLQASYYGGSGEDEISALSALGEAGFVYLGGSSNSTDLPGFASPALLEPARAGTKDVFIVKVSSLEGFANRRVVGGPGLVADVPLTFGIDSPVRAAGRITATSADPSTALVTFVSSADGTPTDTSLWTSTGAPPASLRIECQKSSGGTTVTLQAAGMTDQQLQVVCVAGELSWDSTELDAPIWVGRRTSFLQLNASVVDPLTGKRSSIGQKFSSGRSQTATVSVANLRLGRFVDSAGRPVTEVTINGSFLYFEALEAGDTSLIAQSPNFPTLIKSIRVIAPTDRAQSYNIAAGYSGVGVLTNLGGRPNSGTVKSLDPSRVLVSNDGVAWSAGPIATDSTGGFRFRGLLGVAAGSDASLETTMTGTTGTVIQTVRFADPEVASSSALQDSLTLYNGESRAITVFYRAGKQFVIPFDAALSSPLAAVSSNIAVVPQPDPAGLSNPAINLSARTEGLSIITFQAPAGLSLAPELRRPLTVRVIRTNIDIGGGADVNLGKDLRESVLVRLPFGPATAADTTIRATCSVDRPDLVKFAPSSIPADTATVDLYSGQGVLYLQGYANSGVAVVTCQTANYGSASVRVLLRPVGYVWNFEESSSYPGARLSFEYQPAALDPVTNIPLAKQRFGALSVTPPAPQIDNSNPVVLSPDAGSWNVLQPGEAILTLRQPAGFLTPALRQKHRFTTPRYSTQSLVRVVISGYGTVDGCSTNPCVMLKDPGSTITFTARPATGYKLERWSNNSCAVTCTITIPQQLTPSTFALTAYFVPASAPLGSRFVRVDPCRLVDTRTANGSLGGPAIPARRLRNFPVRSACGLPANASAYSLNVTVVPRGPLGYLTIWPGDQLQPVASTLNALDGRVKANAAIVPASLADGSVNVYATDLTDVILDVNGAFVPSGQSAGQSTNDFYSVPPCRLLDTRLPGSGGSLTALTERAISIGGSCGVPAFATAYVLNVTAIPKTTLGYLTLWPSGSTRPTVSTLNAVTGAVTANMAIVPVGGNSSINAFATDAVDLVIDVAGYFDSTGSNPLQFYTASPCRVLDTRLADGAFGGPVLSAGASRDFSVPSSECGIPASAKAYSISATVVPPGLLGYLTLYPTGSTRPVASTLNAVDGSITSNAVIVPAGVNGGVTAYVTERTHFLLDINGYFAP